MQSTETSTLSPSTIQYLVASQDTPVAEFLYQLTRILTEGHSDIIEWDNGRILVHDPPKLASDVLNKYFRHSKYSSFQRQLNYFGFRKIAGKGKLSACSYVNDSVSPDIRSLMFIKRKTCRNSVVSHISEASCKLSTKRKVEQESFCTNQNVNHKKLNYVDYSALVTTDESSESDEFDAASSTQSPIYSNEPKAAPFYGQLYDSSALKENTSRLLPSVVTSSSAIVSTNDNRSFDALSFCESLNQKIQIFNYDKRDGNPDVQNKNFIAEEVKEINSNTFSTSLFMNYFSEELQKDLSKFPVLLEPTPISEMFGEM